MTAVVLPLLLTAVVLVPRLSASMFLVTPARDMVRYVEAAEALRTLPLKDAVRSMDCHPLYPAALLGAKTAITAAFGVGGPDAWVLAGETVGIGCFLLFLLTAYALGARQWGATIAFWGCAIVALLPRQVSYTVDVLTDSLHAWMWMSCLYWLSDLQRPAPWRRYALAGLFAGFAYWTRSEALLLPIMACLGGMVIQCIPSLRIPWRSAGLCAAAFGICWGATAGSYVGIIGRLSPRNSASALTGQKTVAETVIQAPVELAVVGNNVVPPAAKPATVAAPIAETPIEPIKIADRPYVGDEAYEIRPFGKAAVALLWEIGQETRVWMLPLVLWGLLGFLKPAAWNPMAVFMTIAWVGYAAILILLQMKCGYIAGRYLMPLMPSLGMLAAIGIAACLRTIDRLAPHVQRLAKEPSLRPRRGRLVATLAIVLVALGTSVPAWFRSNHRHRQTYVDAAEWIKEHTAPGETVFDPIQLVSFYADRPNWRPSHPDQAIPVRYAVVDLERVYRTDLNSHGVIKRFIEFGRPVEKFVTKKSNREGVVYILEWRQSASAIQEKGGLR
jgi:hypothetical protein